MDAATTWMGTELSTTDHTQAFVFQHKNLIGQNHHDNAFETGSNQDANPTQQNNFISTLANNGVRYDISGHDHVDYRSVVTSPNGNSSVQEIICASDSYKYYTPAAPTDSRDNPVAEQLNKTGYYIYTVDGPRVTAKYYSTTPLSNGDVPSNATFTLQDTFGYSLNGKEKLVLSGSSYAMTDNTDVAKTMESGFTKGTKMAITSGSNSGVLKDYMNRSLSKDLNTAWTAKSATTVSDILTLTGMEPVANSGMGTFDKFTLTLTFDASAFSRADLEGGNILLGTKDANGNWVNAIALDHGTNTGSNYLILGTAADASTAALGTYGIDLSTFDADQQATVWAVIDHNSDFAAVPEPSTYALIGTGIAAFLGMRRRRSA